MSYSTYTDWRNHWGADRSAALVAGTEAVRQAVVVANLSAFGGRINSAAQAGGYTVPLDPAALTADAELQTQLGNLLRLNEIVGATYFYLQPQDDSPRVKEARKALEDWLAQLARGEGLPVARPAVAGSLEWIPADSTTEFSPVRLAAARRITL